MTRAAHIWPQAAPVNDMLIRVRVARYNLKVPQEALENGDHVYMYEDEAERLHGAPTNQ